MCTGLIGHLGENLKILAHFNVLAFGCVDLKVSLTFGGGKCWYGLENKQILD